MRVTAYEWPSVKVSWAKGGVIWTYDGGIGTSIECGVSNGKQKHRTDTTNHIPRIYRWATININSGAPEMDSPLMFLKVNA